MLPKLMIWDLGNVLVNFRDSWLGKQFLEICDAPAEAVKNFFQGENFFRYERDGREFVASREFFEIFKRELRYRHDFDKFAVDFCAGCGFELNREAFDLFNDLKVKYAKETEFWMLSNLNELHYRHIRSRWPGVFASFAREVVSFRAGARKPEPEIYRHLLRLWGGAACDCLFIDDTKINLDAAEAQGINCLLFEGADKLRSVLDVMEIK